MIGKNGYHIKYAYGNIFSIFTALSLFGYCSTAFSADSCGLDDTAEPHRIVSRCIFISAEVDFDIYGMIGIEANTTSNTFTSSHTGSFSLPNTGVVLGDRNTSFTLKISNEPISGICHPENQHLKKVTYEQEVNLYEGNICSISFFSDGTTVYIGGNYDSQTKIFDARTAFYSYQVKKPEISVNNGYVKLDVINNAIPESIDCVSESDYGRLVYSQAQDGLYLCSKYGWKLYQ